jgi:putative ABC transport system substrate-binding protein
VKSTRRQFLSFSTLASVLLLGGCDSIHRALSTSGGARRIGYLGVAYPEYIPDSINAFVDELRQRGWIEGDNLTIEWRFSEGHNERLPELAAELVHLQVDLIAATTTPGTLAAQQETTTIPTVSINALDLLALGAVKSLARPGGNITGITYGGGTIGTKAVELLKTVLPQLERVAVLGDRSNPAYNLFMSPVATTAASLGIRTLELDVRDYTDVDRAFEHLLAWKADGLLLLPTNFEVGFVDHVGELALRNRVPAMYEAGPPTHAGGQLMSFSPNGVTQIRAGADYIDKILRGTNPADLPVEEPRTYDFVAYVKTAAALGIAFPSDAAVQVTQWIDS